MLRQETGAEIALLPGVGYGLSIQAGAVTREELYTLLPHDSTVVTLSLTGAQIRDVLEQSARNLQPENPLEKVGGLVQTAGISWTADLTRPAGERVREVLVEGRLLHPQRRYRVATHSGMLAGIHRYDSLGQGEEIERSDEPLNALVERQMRERRRLEAPAPARITVIGGD